MHTYPRQKFSRVSALVHLLEKNHCIEYFSEFVPAIAARHPEDDTFMSNEEEDTCMSNDEEDTCHCC
jgi:hypothetical protein